MKKELTVKYFKRNRFVVVIFAKFRGETFIKEIDVRGEIWELGDNHRRLEEKLEQLAYNHFGFEHPGATTPKDKRLVTQFMLKLNKQLYG